MMWGGILHEKPPRPVRRWLRWLWHALFFRRVFIVVDINRISKAAMHHVPFEHMRIEGVVFWAELPWEGPPVIVYDIDRLTKMEVEQIRKLIAEAPHNESDVLASDAGLDQTRGDLTGEHREVPGGDR